MWIGSEYRNITGEFSEFYNMSYEDEPIKVEISIKKIMSGKTDSIENMLNGIKPYKELNSIQKIACKYDYKKKCTNCNYKGLCPNDVLIVCIQSFEKGFITGVKHHRKIVKERTENKISKIFRISYKEIREKLIKYFKDYDYGYFADTPKEDIIEFLNSK